ncbi:YifB family Mg chelatase-like AAA ATPase [Curtobacterium sp. RRHDQ10]|uniref:YifB family Mg chelatase-like AAA ATPase n=1 Tax=Curtobacterium phyllosphaerae TaxID=3413379 RepID=UPI003BF0BD32
MSGVGRTSAVALLGITGRLVEVEAHLSSQLPGFSIIGLPDASLGEARERVRSAASNAGSALPARKITVNLTPASVPKHGSGFDLAIAIAVFAADGLVRPDLADVVHIGELGLDGRVRPVPGVIPMLVTARAAGATRAVVPAGNHAEARSVPGIRVDPVVTLRDAAVLAGADLPEQHAIAVDPPTVQVAEPRQLELADVVGNDLAVRALVVAAAGGHHMLLLGPPGAGKTMLAERLPGLLPDLDTESALEVAAVRSVAGLGAESWTTRPPWESPHHSSSAVALIGGGSRMILPGAVSRASSGVLFLDEATEFPRTVLDMLRQPLESGTVTIHRASGRATFPARFQLVLAANPCPCGNAGSGDPGCSCPPSVVRRYFARLSGPLLDRVDIRFAVPRVTPARIRAASEQPITTAAAQESITLARRRMRARWSGTPWSRNAHVSGPVLRRPEFAPDPGAAAVLDRGLEIGSLTMRGHDRVVRLAWTLADLADVERPTLDHVRQALALRSAL